MWNFRSLGTDNSTVLLVHKHFTKSCIHCAYISLSIAGQFRTVWWYLVQWCNIMQCCDRQYSRRERWICSVNLTAIMHFLRDAVSPKYFQWALWRQSASHGAMPRSGNNRKRGTPRGWSLENRECVLTMYFFLFLIPPFLHPPQNFTSWAIPPCVCKLPYICPEQFVAGYVRLCLAPVAAMDDFLCYPFGGGIHRFIFCDKFSCCEPMVSEIDK